MEALTCVNALVGVRPYQWWLCGFPWRPPPSSPAMPARCTRLCVACRSGWGHLWEDLGKNWRKNNERIWFFLSAFRWSNPNFRISTWTAQTHERPELLLVSCLPSGPEPELSHLPDHHAQSWPGTHPVASTRTDNKRKKQIIQRKRAFRWQW